MRYAFWVLLAASMLQAQGVNLVGTQRLSDAALINVAGLQVGTPPTKSALDAACGRLMKTGLLESCRYQTDSRGVVFQVHESKADQQARITIPNVDTEKLWGWMETHQPLVQRQMPANDDAIAFYAAAVQRYLKANGLPSDIKPDIRSDIGKREITILFRPSNLEKVTVVKFTGAADPERLQRALQKSLQDFAYTEYDFRELLAEVVRPIYFEQGRLKVQFPSVTFQSGTVTTAIDEGPVYRLGKVDLPGLNTGDVADWRNVTKATNVLEQAARNEGYLRAKANVEQVFNESAHTVNLSSSLDKGERFAFGKLIITGLTPDLEPKVRALWTLQPGAPMNEAYVDEFSKLAFQKGGLGPEYRGISQQLEVPPGYTTVNVQIAFKR